MTRAVVLLLIAAALILASAAHAYTRSPLLESKEPTPFPTFCADSDVEWIADAGLGVLGYTWIAGPLVSQIYLSPDTCDALDKGPAAKGFPTSVATLYHEWVHAYFLERSDKAEGNAECVSLYFLRYELRHKWGLSGKAAQRIYKQAWETHVARGLFYPLYRGTCAYPQYDPVP